MEKNCTYRRIESDPYADTYLTDCGKRITYEGAIEVGFGFNPKPTDDGRAYCAFCGGKIKEVRK